MSEITPTKLTREQLTLAQMFKALGNPVRLEIVQHLAVCDQSNCGDIVAALPLAQSTVSQHLKVLKDAGLIKGEIEGSAVCYCLDHDSFDWMKRKISEYL
jgi:DNA-binding transcriptional ArsR family regulator